VPLRTVLETSTVRKVISNFFTFARKCTTKCRAALMRAQRLPFEDRAERVAAVEHGGGALRERIPVGHVPPKGIGEPDDHAEQCAHRCRVAQCLFGNAGGTSSVGVRFRQLVRAKRQLLEEGERRGKLGPQWRGPPVVDDRLPDFLTERIRRDRAVGARSERALVE
jgi:hypothetical protein